MALVYLDSSVSCPGALHGPGDERTNRLPLVKSATARIG